MFDKSEQLILIKGEDKTNSVTSVYHDTYHNVIKITYHGMKQYPYRQTDVKILNCTRSLDITNQIVMKHGEACYGVRTVQYFRGYTRLIYKNGARETFYSHEIKVIDSALHDPNCKKCFEYLKKLAEAVGLKSEDGHNILAGRYEKIDFVREDSVFAAYLGGELKENTVNADKTPILPFGFNISQKQAVDRALTNKVSVIEGPPGTGKTQTILNIIANAVMRGESVAVVAGNNSATDNVLEKLKKYHIDFIAAPLGSVSNKEAFIEHQTPTIPNEIDSWYVDPFSLEKLRIQLKDEGTELHKMLTMKNELSELTLKNEALKKEKEHFADTDSGWNPQNLLFSPDMSADAILSFVAEYECTFTLPKWKRFFYKILWGFRYHVSGFQADKMDIQKLQDYSNREYYNRKIPEMQNRIGELKRQLNGYRFEERMKSYTDLSMTVFKAKLQQRYAMKKIRMQYSLEDLFKRSDAFTEDYPVILSTTYSLRSSLSCHFIYDYVIMDEASQVDIATGALALSCAKKAVIVGDLKQLPNVVTEDAKEKTDEIFNRCMMQEPYRYAGHSILSSVTEVFHHLPRTLLREHYRCHPEIIGFCNSRFYNNQLIILTKPKSDRPPLAVYRTAPGNHAKEHVNRRQIEVITDEVMPQEKLDVMSGEVGIVTPYRAQANTLQQVFAGTNVKADTADKFQGQEKEVMIFSTVDNEIGDFAADPNRLNVAVSRAIDEFIVVTDDNHNDETSPIHELIEYIQYQNHEVVHSAISSVFDMLYKGQEKAREKAMERFGRVSEYESENLMYQVIKSVLCMDDFSKYDVVCHVPLRMILRDLSKLESRELAFATNHLTHVDFLIFSKLTHKPVLVIEVDGYGFHDKNSKQLERDAVKDTILQKYHMPIVRFSTIGSGEKQKLITALQAI